MTTPGQQPPVLGTCRNCGTPVRPDIDWFCPNPACGYPQFWQPGEHPDEALAGTMRHPVATDPDPATNPGAEGGPPEAGGPLTTATITCWNCKTVNYADRTDCRRCGEQLRRVPGVVASDAPPRRLGGFASRDLLVGGLLLALVLLAGAAALNARFGTPSPDGTPSSPPPRSATTTSVAPLPVARASASSAWTGEVGHTAAAVTDSNPATAWISAPGRPVGESVTVVLPRAAVVTEIGIANGYQRPGRYFAANGRAARVLISFDDGRAAERTLADRPGLQVFPLTEQTSPTRSTTRSVLIQILSVRPARAANVAISTVTVRGHPR